MQNICRLTFGRCGRSKFSQKTKNVTAEEDLTNRPYEYLGSKAETYKASEARLGKSSTEWPSYQPYVVNASIAIFLIYFCILREENDIDEKLGASLYDHVPDMEIVQLRNAYKHNLQNNLSNDAIIKRLEELGIPPPT